MGIFITLLKDLVWCAFATVFYAILMNAPKKSIPLTSILAALGYVTYDFIYLTFGLEITAYFIGTLVISVGGEIIARIVKLQSTVFILPAIVPIVPGFGIYKTMLFLVEDDYASAARTGTNTLLIAGAMAVAIAIINVIARHFIPKRLKVNK